MHEHVDPLKALADPNRLRLYWLLARIDQRICVTEAMDVLGASHYNASRHLKLLQKAGLVVPEKDGKWVFYRLREAVTPFAAGLLAAVRAIPDRQFAVEVRRCKQRLALRQDGRCVVGPSASRPREDSRPRVRP